MFLTVLSLGSNSNIREKFGDKDLIKISPENFQKKSGAVITKRVMKLIKQQKTGCGLTWYMDN